jgi:hypothetical protein
VYGHFKASISDTLHRTLIWSSAQTIELAVPVGWVCLLPRTLAQSISWGSHICLSTSYQQVLLLVRRYAVRAIQWATPSEKAPGTCQFSSKRSSFLRVAVSDDRRSCAVELSSGDQVLLPRTMEGALAFRRTNYACVCMPLDSSE